MRLIARQLVSSNESSCHKPRSVGKLFTIFPIELMVRIVNSLPMERGYNVQSRAHAQRRVATFLCCNIVTRETMLSCKLVGV